MPKPAVSKPRSFPTLGHGGGSWGWDEIRRKVTLRFRVDGRSTIVRADTTTRCLQLRDERRAEASARAAVTATLANGQGTVGQMLDSWFAYHAGGRAPCTQDTYRRSIELIRRTGFAERTAREVTRGDIQNLLLHFVDTGVYGFSAVHKIRTHLHMAFEHGQDHGYVIVNPAVRIKLPGHVRKPSKPVWLDEASFDTMRQYLVSKPSTANVALLTGLLTGLRPGEVLAICWDALDLDAGVLQVRRNLQRSNGGRVRTLVDDLKTDGSARTVSLRPDLVAALRHEHTVRAERQLAATRWQDNDLVFTRQDGRPLAFWTLDWSCRKACQAIGIELLSPHKLRHTNASILLDRGVAPADVAKHLGHKNTRMLTMTYEHSVRTEVSTDALG